MVYLILNKEDNTCKIGYSNDPIKRLSALQVANASELKLVAQIEGDMELEKSLHTKFKEFHIKGEWFVFSDDIRDYFKVESNLEVIFNGTSWIFQFTGIELQMLIVLLELEDLKTGIVSITPLLRDHLILKFSKTKRYIRTIIANLETKKALVKITSQDFILNPSYFYKGGTKVFRKKLAQFNIHLNKK